MPIDRVDYPMPAIRFREATNEINALREKEKQDWKKMSTEEKKALYRASFCQTFAEMKAGTGEWKLHLGLGLIFSTLAIWVAIFMNTFGKFRNNSIFTTFVFIYFSFALIFSLR